MSTTTLPEYNGWTNYPTWNAVLWLMNDEGLYRDMLDFVGREARDTHDVTAYVKRLIIDNNREHPQTGPACDMRDWARQYGKSLLWALGQIDYERVREAMIECAE